ncbi:hypothetical protein CsSME_00006546 [Camellia sinensis var. sinensis]
MFFIHGALRHSIEHHSASEEFLRYVFDGVEDKLDCHGIIFLPRKGWLSHSSFLWRGTREGTWTPPICTLNGLSGDVTVEKIFAKDPRLYLPKTKNRNVDNQGPCFAYAKNDVLSHLAGMGVSTAGGASLAEGERQKTMVVGGVPPKLG